MEKATADIRKRLRETARSAPEGSGVYIWKDGDGVIIYVGKARSLKNRLTTYFSSKADIKTRHLVARATSLEWIHTDTEYEALLLENNLIKRHAPKYNIMLKDGKTYPSIRITNEDYPRLFRTRRIINDGSRYFGPYPGTDVLDKYIDLIRRLFPLRRCHNMHRRQGPCMYYHIGRCSAPCAGKISKEEYAVVVDKVAALLSGETDQLLARLDTEMNEAAMNLRFEKAAELRDAIQAIRNFRADSAMEDFSDGDRDYLAWQLDGSLVTFVVFQARAGKLVGRDLFRERCFGHIEEAVQSFLLAYYSDGRAPPPCLFIQEALDLQLVEQFFRQELSSECAIKLPEERRHTAAMAMASHNAREDIAKRRRETGDLEAMEALRNALGLESLPEFIQGFDIAQLSGKHSVASLVSFKNGIPDKKNYRIFKIRSLEGAIDDFGAMREASARHFTRLVNEDAQLPDLLLIDGGRGQVNAVYEVVSALGLELPVVGLAKENEELWPHGASKPVVLDHNSAALRLAVAIRDEAHRFATGMNQRLRGKSVSFGVLEAVKGIGPAKAKKIMEQFGSLSAVAEAEPAYLAKTSGISQETAEALQAAIQDKKLTKPPEASATVPAGSPD